MLKLGVSLAEKAVIFFWKLSILNLNFQGKGPFYADFLFYILITYGKCLAIQFLSRCICIYFPILTGDKNERFNSWKVRNILQNCSFWSATSKMKRSYMPLSCFIFLLFNVNSLLFSYNSRHTYVLYHSNRGLIWTLQ